MGSLLTSDLQGVLDSKHGWNLSKPGDGGDQVSSGEKWITMKLRKRFLEPS
jgi:hypothetical protein